MKARSFITVAVSNTTEKQEKALVGAGRMFIGLMASPLLVTILRGGRLFSGRALILWLNL